MLFSFDRVTGGTQPIAGFYRMRFCVSISSQFGCNIPDTGVEFALECVNWMAKKWLADGNPRELERLAGFYFSHCADSSTIGRIWAIFSFKAPTFSMLAARLLGLYSSMYYD